MLQRLDHSFRHEREFLERASHELRTPLTALRAEIDLALSHPRNADELTAALRSVSDETDRLAHLAEDLLVLARTSNGTMALHRQPIALHETLKSAAALFAARARQEGITLTVRAPGQTISADPLRLRQALVNLHDNALRHTPRGGTIHLTAEVTDTATHIVVSDTGPGFTLRAGDLDDDYGVAPHPNQPGLGLRIVQAITASHRGTLRIGRNQHQGARSNSPCPSPVAVNQPRNPGPPCHTPEQPPQPRLANGPDIAGRAKRRRGAPAPLLSSCAPRSETPAFHRGDPRPGRGAPASLSASMRSPPKTPREAWRSSWSTMTVPIGPPTSRGQGGARGSRRAVRGVCVAARPGRSRRAGEIIVSTDADTPSSQAGCRPSTVVRRPGGRRRHRSLRTL